LKFLLFILFIFIKEFNFLLYLLTYFPSLVERVESFNMNLIEGAQPRWTKYYVELNYYN
jgi:hypothetical protein